MKIKGKRIYTGLGRVYILFLYFTLFLKKIKKESVFYEINTFA